MPLAARSLCIAGALLAVGCGGRAQTLADVLPHVAITPGAQYSEQGVASCLQSRRVLAAVPGLANIRATFAAHGPVPAGLTGEIVVIGGGRPFTPLGKALERSPWYRPSSKYAPASFDSGSLVFFRTQRAALSGARRVVELELFRVGLSATWKSFYNDLYGKPPPLSAVPRLVAVQGNVLAVWDYPRAYPTRSARLLAGCLRANRR